MSRHQWQPNQCEQQIKARSNHWILFFDNLCLLKDSMKRPLHLSGLAQIVVNKQCFVFISIGQSLKYTHFKSLRQYYVHAMSWPNVLKHYSCRQMKRNWFTNTCGINKGRTCITFFSSIQDQIAQYIFLNVQERKFCISTLTFTLLMSILLPLTHWLFPYKNNISSKVTHDTIHTKNQQIFE